MNKQVRNGQLVAVTCPKCGCRLDGPFDLYGSKAWTHYTLSQDVINGTAKNDAKGHTCKYLNMSLYMFSDGIRGISSSYTTAKNF